MSNDQLSVKSYPLYKNSGVEWLGDVPEHWGLSRIKQKGTVRGRVGWKALKADEYVDEGYIFLSTPNIKEKDIDFANVNYITYERYIESPEIMIQEGDILLTKDGSTLGTTNIVSLLPREATVNSSIAVVRFNKDIFKKYIYYQILSEFIQNKIHLKKSGMGVPHLFQRDINNFFILIPSLSEQKAIGDYLDTKTAQCDRKIDLLSQKAKLYSNLKQSLINETVTRGLDKSVPMKDSEIEWIGEVPEHWELKRIKEVAYINNKTLSDKTPNNYKFDYVDIGSVTYGAKSFISESMTFDNAPSRARRIVKKGDTIISTVRTYLKAITSIDNEVSNLIVSTGFCVISPKKKLFSKYLSYLVTSNFIVDNICAFSTGVSYPATNASVISNLSCLILPLNEQKAIADYLDTKTAQIDQIIQTINAQIEKLKELRKTLINDVVTGKIKVV